MMVASCPRCASEVTLHEGHPEIAGTTIRLWHRACWDERAVPLTVAVAVVPPPPFVRRRYRRWYIAPVAASAGMAVCCLHWATFPDAQLVPSITLDTEESDPGLSHESVTVHEDPPPAMARVEEPRKETVAPSIESLEERYPMLRDWIHPVLAAREVYPPQESRHFGAERRGIMRAECGGGHCGVDLDGPRGQPVLAVAAGTLVRLERHELGLDGRSGRYVRIQHEDGTLTAYMHLDAIVDGLHVGDHVDAGQVVGVLGATATFRAPAHLHFSLELPDRPSLRGDITDTHYIDPEPFLRRAAVLDAPIVADASATSPERAASE
jgi:hypothetical protein